MDTNEDNIEQEVEELACFLYELYLQKKQKELQDGSVETIG